MQLRVVHLHINVAFGGPSQLHLIQHHLRDILGVIRSIATQRNPIGRAIKRAAGGADWGIQISHAAAVQQAGRSYRSRLGTYLNPPTVDSNKPVTAWAGSDIAKAIDRKEKVAMCVFMGLSPLVD